MIKISELWFKTINGMSILGKGNINISGGGGDPVQLKTINGESIEGEGNIDTTPKLKTVGGQSLLGSGNIPLPSVSGLESTANKVTGINAQSTNTAYPSAKAVYEYVDDIVGDINAALETIMGGGA